MKINQNFFDENRSKKIYYDFISKGYKSIINKFNIEKKYYRDVAIPLALGLDRLSNKKPLKIYISGGQGSGKTTLSIILKHFLEKYLAKRVVTFSIDDLYLSKEDRLELAQNVHPLLKTRGVPGTHDIEHGIKIIKSLSLKNSKKTLIPKFSKEFDDLIDKKKWNVFIGIPDIIIVEGWCMGAKPMKFDFWEGPINSLEEKFDPNGFWSKWVNQKLANNYQVFFNMFDLSIYIQSNNFSEIIKNRISQEKNAINFSKSKDGYMSENQIINFVMHFERISKSMFRYMPKKSNIVIERDIKGRFSIIKLIKKLI